MISSDLLDDLNLLPVINTVSPKFSVHLSASSNTISPADWLKKIILD